MQIVDADIKTLQRAAKRGRVRTQETQELIDVIEGLSIGKAKAVLVSRGEKPEKIRDRIAYASKIAGKPLQIAVGADRVLFALKEQKRGRGRPRKQR